MAYLEFKNVRIAGIAAGVPKNIQKNDDGVVHSDNYDAAAYVETTGVIERRIDETSTTSDLSLAATERLLADLGKRQHRCVVVRIADCGLFSSGYGMYPTG